MKTLAEMAVGEKGIIDSITNSNTALTLMEMGCIPGEEILLENIAPFGDPIAIKVSGYKLSLRIREAQHVLIKGCTF